MCGSQAHGSQPLPLVSFQWWGAHWSHLGPTTWGRHRQRPLSSSHGMFCRDPRTLQSQPAGGRATEILADNQNSPPEDIHEGGGPAWEGIRQRRSLQITCDSQDHRAFPRGPALAAWPPALLHRLPSRLLAQAGAATCWNPVAQHVASQKPGQVLSLVAPRAIPKPGHAGSPYSRWQPFVLAWVSPVKSGLHRSQRSCSLHMHCPVTGSQGAPCTCSLHKHCQVTGSQGAPSTAPYGSHSQAERNGHHSRNKEGKQGVTRRLKEARLPSSNP